MERQLTANELILDLLQAHEQHCLSVADLTRAAQLFGIQESAVRVALTRLTKQGKLGSQARGVYSLCREESTMLGEAEDWLARERLAVTWNGNWLAVSDAEVARSDKTPWRRHQRALGLRGFRRLAEGFYLRPDNLRGGVAGVHADLLRLGLAKASLVVGVTELDPLSGARVGQLWDIPRLEGQYASLLARLAESSAALPLLPAAQAARQSLLLGRETIRIILQDPLLPPQLMGDDLRGRLIERMRQYNEEARQHWQSFLAGEA